MEWMASLVTLTALEIVLGIDNLIFITILAGRLPVARQPAARRLGLALALITRLALLASISWIVGLTAPVFEVFGRAVSWRDLILILGGLFLIYKGTHEIHAQVEGADERPGAGGGKGSFVGVVSQIIVLDIVFSLDSVITAVGMSNQLWVMVTAVVVAVAAMLVAADPLAQFVSRHPTVKTLALSFLLLIGMTLVADGFGAHLPKGYIYAAIGFSVLVEMLNQATARRKLNRASPVSRSPAPPPV
jgi:predicted tellurium resistance membrane protein TerC